MLLGIVTVDGRIWLREASAAECPGHQEWLQQETGLDVMGAFSLAVAKGRVDYLFRKSSLNAEARDFLLDADLAHEVASCLPCADGLVFFGD